jgi:translocation and assembly module TamB
MRLRRTLKILLASILVLGVIAAGGLYWIVSTPGGAQLVLGRVANMLGKGAKIEGVEGQLGGLLRIKSIVIDQPDLYVRIEGLEIDSAPFRAFGGRLLVHKLYAREVEVRTASTKAAARVPVSFKPPYAVRLEDGRIGTLTLGQLPRGVAPDTVLKDIVVRGEGDKSLWKVDEAAVATEYGVARLAGTLGNAPPFAADLRADFAGKLQERELRVVAKLGGTLTALEADLHADLAGTEATAHAVLQPFAEPPVKSLALEARDLDLAKIDASLPATRLAVTARLAPEGKTAFAGPVRIVNADPGPWDKQGLPFASLTGRIVASAEGAQLTGLNVALAGGAKAAGRASIRKGAVEAELEVVDLDLAALHGGLQKTKATGRITIAADGNAQRFDVALSDPRFDVEGRAAIAAKRLDVETVRVKTGGGSVVAKGGMALEGRKEFRFEGRAEHFDPSAFANTSKGDLNFAFTTNGTLEGGVSGQVKVDIAPSTLGTQPASGRINVAGDAKRISSADVAIAIGEGRLEAKGAFGRAGDAMDISFRAPNLAALAKPFGVEAAGSAEGTARLTGTFASPAGRVDVKGTNLVLPSNVYARALAFRGEAGADPQSAIDVTVQAQGVAVGKDNPPTSIAETANATLKGTRAAHRFELDARMTKDTSFRTALQGGLDARAKTLTWNGTIESFRMEGRGAFALASPATLNASAERVEVGDALLRGDWGEAHALVTRWTPRSLDFKGNTSGIRIQNLARSLRLGDVPRSNLVIAGEWDIRAADTFEGSLDIHRVSGDLRVGEPAIALGLQEMRLHFDAVRGRATGSLQVVGERIGRITGDGSALIVRGDTGWEFAKTAPLDAHIVADMPSIEALTPWLGAEAKLAGHVSANITVSGTGAEPSVNGVAKAEGLTVREPQSGFEVAEGDIALRMSGRTVAIERFVAKTPWNVSERAKNRMRRVRLPEEGTGTITAEGSIDLGSRRGAIRLKADKVPVTQLATRFVALSGEARLEAGDGGLVANGDFKVDGGWIGALAEALPSVSDDVVVIRASQPPAEEKSKEPIRIDLKLALNDRMYFEGRGLDTRLDGEIRVIGELGSPLRASGRIRTADGTYEGYGQKLEIERGVLTFNGPLDNPQLDVLALRKGLPVEAGVEISGTTTRPRVRMVSRPDVPEPEKLSWLVLGRGAADASPGDMSVMLAAARALLGNNQPGSDFTEKLGIDEVKIGRSDAGSVLGVLPQSTVAGRTGSPAAADVVSVGKRLNRNLQLNYEQGLADSEGTIKIAWRITRGFQVLVRAGYLPGIDAVWRWTLK